MDDVLLGIVLRRLERFLLAEQVADLLLAALESDESLSAQLGAGRSRIPVPRRSRVRHIRSAPTCNR
jgi:hypothetical protein